MPVLLFPLVIGVALLCLLLVIIVLVPLGIVQRYRTGTARQKARPWLAALNAVGFAISAMLVLATAVVAALWEPRVLPWVAAGLAVGAALGQLALWRSHWEATDEGLYFTPQRWLVLTLLLLVAARLGWGLWRAWHTVTAGPGDESWLAAAGVAGTMAAGAVVIGYSLIYWLGVRRRVLRHR